MNFLPVADRELRVACRKPGTYRMRWMLAGSVLLIWFFLLGTNHHLASNADKGKMLFTAIGVLAFGFCLLAGVFSTAHCLSDEKTEGTLGLLFLTKLKGYDVVLGKLIATSLHVFYGLLAILPLLALPLLIGGVSVGEFWRVTVVLITTLLLSLSIGMLVSASSRDTRTAIGRTLLAIILLSGLPATIWAIAREFGVGNKYESLLLLGPGYLLSRAYDMYYRTRVGQGDFLLSWSILFSLGIALLAAAAVWLPKSWREKVEPAPSAANKSAYFSSARYIRANFQMREAWLTKGNAFRWLASRDQRPRRLSTMILAGLFLIWLCFVPGCFAKGRNIQSMSFTVLMFMSFAMHQILKIQIAIEASRRMSEDRHSGALELLLVTPVPVEVILTGHTAGLKDTFRWPIRFVVAVNLIMFWLLAFPNPMHMGGEERPVFCEMYLGGIIMLLLDAFALRWVGMWMGFRKGRHHSAIFANILRVVLIPWLAAFLFIFVMAGSGGPGSAMGFWVFVYFLLGFVIDATQAATASQGLREGLRDLGTPVPMANFQMLRPVSST